jgi:hypothetical protein
VPDGLPSQLVKLTRLQVSYGIHGCDVAVQLQHLSALTALKAFAFEGKQRACYDPEVLARKLSPIRHLVQLTSLDISAEMQFSTSSTNGWAAECLTALESLSLHKCQVQPQALAAFTQLRALSLREVEPLDAPYLQLINAVSELTLLTQLKVHFPGVKFSLELNTIAEAFTALTASTNLHVLQLSSRASYHRYAKWGHNVLHDCVRMQPDQVYPHLRHIDLQCVLFSGMLISEQQLQVLCSCCPAVESLAVVLEHDASSTAFLPLLQLSALTQLAVQQQCFDPESGAKAAAAAVGVVAQLTGLQHLEVWGFAGLRDPVLLQLTSLKALHMLALHAKDQHVEYYYPPDVDFHVTFQNKVRGSIPCQRVLDAHMFALANLGAPVKTDHLLS